LIQISQEKEPKKTLIEGKFKFNDNPRRQPNGKEQHEHNGIEFEQTRDVCQEAIMDIIYWVRK
jgi:hypothetical protein